MDYVDLLSKDVDGRFRALGNRSNCYEVEKETRCRMPKGAVGWIRRVIRHDVFKGYIRLVT